MNSHLESIGSFSFSYSGLEKVTLPTFLKELGTCAFYYCGELTEVDINHSLKEIEAQTFGGCENITKVISRAEQPPLLDRNAFIDDIYDIATLYVPLGSKELYMGAENWERFFNVEEENFANIENVNMSTGSNVHYDLKGNIIDNPVKGIYITNGKKILK